MGDVTNCQRINDSDCVRPNFASLAGGVAANGLASMVCGLAGSFGPNSYSSCVGLSAATGVTSRIVGYAVGIAFIVLALVPGVLVFFAAMPLPVMGAALFFTAAFVFTSGIQIITARMLDARKTMVIGFSFAMAVMADVYHDVFTKAPVALQPIVANSLVLGTVCALALHLILRFGVRQRVAIELAAGQRERQEVEQFLSQQGSRWGARRDIINRAIFGAAQVLEVIGNPPGGVALEASFDEFSLDLRMRYKGSPLVIPEKRPSPREILSSDEGERLFAGYLLRRSADRISSTSDGTGADVHLHYDH
jgi:NCS2 family nucleobase:cation symporter-2